MIHIIGSCEVCCDTPVVCHPVQLQGTDDPEPAEVDDGRNSRVTFDRKAATDRHFDERIWIPVSAVHSLRNLSRFVL